jgi:hypothetical protein
MRFSLVPLLLVLASRAAPAVACNADNCLNNFNNNAVLAAQFCSTYTTAVVTATTSLPAFIRPECTTAAVRLSSACTCMFGVVTPTVTATATATSTNTATVTATATSTNTATVTSTLPAQCTQPITNGGFENGLSPWTASSGNSDTSLPLLGAGNFLATLANSGTNLVTRVSVVSQTGTFTAGTVYQAIWYVKASGCHTNIEIDWASGSSISTLVAVGGGGYQGFSYTFTALSASGVLSISTQCPLPANSQTLVYIDQVTVYPGS